MRPRSRLGVRGLWVPGLAVLALGPLAALAEGRAEFVGSYVMTEDLPYFGGFSGLEFSADGLSFTALSDSAAILAGRVTRDMRGAVTGIVPGAAPGIGPEPLRDAAGAVLDGDFDDAEGLAQAADGSIYVSFELEHRIVRYTADGVLSATLPVVRDIAGLEDNSGLEAVAIDPDGVIYALPEGSAAGATSVPVFRFRDGRWDKAFQLSQQDSWRPVGADFGPDGRLYLLERDFWGLFGFMSRLRRISFDDAGLIGEEVLFSTRAGRHGNLEGLAIWTDATGGLRATMISDNNFLPILRTEFVDYLIRD